MAPHPALTDRQQQIARLAAARWTSKEIADALGLSPRTVDNQLQRVFRTLGIHSRRELEVVLAPR